MKFKAFTLAELLIALAVLGVIATFTIPKVLTAQSDAKYNAMAKEAISMLSGAFATYQIDNMVTTSFSAKDLEPYINCTRRDTSSLFDDVQGLGTTIGCFNSDPCYFLHNGSLIQLRATTFYDDDPNQAIIFRYDPDGVVTSGGSSSGPGRSILLFMYRNGRITSWGNIDSPTYTGTASWSATPSRDPTWFSWN